MTTVGEVCARLANADFSPLADVAIDRAVTYHRSKYERSKFGAVETVVAVFPIDSCVTIDALVQMSSAAFSSCESAGRLLKTKPNYVVVYTVFIVSGARELDEFVKAYRPKHWKTREFPVLIDAVTGELFLNRTIPVWGAAYQKGHVRLAEQLFG